MRVSLNWVKQYTDIDVSTEELVKLATERLGGIEDVTNLTKQYEGIVVAKIIECKKHSNADKLNVCKIDDGGAVKNVERDENGYVQVVCGANNVRTGMLVAWIPPSSIVPSSYGEKELFVLEARDLRGVLSNGMLASPRELGISDEHEGILEIDSNMSVSSTDLTRRSGDDEILEQVQDNNSVQPGTPFVELYGLDDTIIEIENKMFTHRPDGFGQLGVARELAGIQHKPFKSPDWYKTPLQIKEEPNSEVKGLSVTIKDEDLCPRYMAVVLDTVVIKQSPVWLQSYLQRVGIHPINNVVDITNYIMLLTAQPLHAFDFDKVAKEGKANIVVRRPLLGEKMTLLGGKEIEPHKDAVLICGADGPIALGGVMGGDNSEIDKNTTRVVLECATFNMYNIRRTSMTHGIFTDAVTRFTKGQPAAQLPVILAKAVEMFEELAGAGVAGKPVDVVSPNTENQSFKQSKTIELSAKFINDRLGSNLSNQEIIQLLTNVEFEAYEASGPISVTPPFWRTDIEIPEDIVEEIGRLYGFNRLPAKLPVRSIAPVSTNEMIALKSEVRHTLARAGANEVLTYSFVNSSLLEKASQDPKQAFAIRNALSPDLEYYRLSILPSLLDKVRANIKTGFEEFTLFEIGKGHNKAVINDQTGLPDEINNLEMVYSSAKPGSGAAYYQMLKTADNLLLNLGISYKLEPVENIYSQQALLPFNLERSAYIYNATKAGGMIGFVGELKESVIKNFKLPAYTAAALFALDGPSFEKQNRNGSSYVQSSKYQTTTQDLTLKVANDMPFATLERFISGKLSKSEYETRLHPIGIYQKEDADTKNITFRIILSHKQRTLTKHEATKLIDTISWRAHEQLQAEKV